MDEKRIKEVFADEVFVKQLFSLETPEEAQTALKAKGIEMSREEVLKLRDALVAASQEAGAGGGELSTEQLDNVAGGFLDTITSIIITIAINDVKSFFSGRW